MKLRTRRCCAPRAPRWPRPPRRSATALPPAGCPRLAEAAAAIGDVQVRNMGTIGGSVAHADPAADYPASLLALGATIVTDRPTIPGGGPPTGPFPTRLGA